MPNTYTGIMKRVGTVPRVRLPHPKPSSSSGVKESPEAGATTASTSSQPAPSTSVRFRDPAIRQMLREVSDAAGLSQRELIEEAVARDLLFRGARLVSDLEEAARRIRALRPHAYRQLMERSIVEFAEGESQGEPIRAQARHATPGVTMEEGLSPALAEALAIFAGRGGVGAPETGANLPSDNEGSGSTGQSAATFRGGSV